jgi:hypothetical protein
MRPCGMLNSTRAIRLLGSDVRTSHRPSPSARQSGIPTGQRYAHEVEADGLTVRVVQAPQPVSHDLSPAVRAVKHDGYFVGTAI